MNLSQVAKRVGMTRQWVHRLRTTDPKFPKAVRAPGSTRDQFDQAEIDAYFANRILRPGERTDLKNRPKNDG